MHQFAKLKSLDKGAEVRFLLLPLKDEILEFLASENISCDKTTLFRSGELLIDEVVKGLILNSSL